MSSQPGSTRMILFFIIMLALILACSGGGTPAGSPAFDATKAVLEMQNTALAAQLAQTADVPSAVPPSVPPSVSPPPTVTVQPTASQEEQPSEIQEYVDRYFQKGYLPSRDGEYHRLDDFSREWAEINYYDEFETGYEAKDFMVIGHFAWESAVQFPDPSGCGLAFRAQGQDEYVFFVDREMVWLGTWDASTRKFNRFGKTSGSAWVGLSNPAEADVALIVSRGKAYVLINESFTSSYTLDTDFLTGPGELRYVIVSGTNKGYGTRCTMTNLHLWIIK